MSGQNLHIAIGFRSHFLEVLEMRIVRLSDFPRVVMHVSDDVYSAQEGLLKEGVLESSVAELLATEFERMFQEHVDEKFMEFVQLYGEQHGRSGIRVLNACGGSRDGKWEYQDESFHELVQVWIDRNEEEYAALVLMVGNEDGHSVWSRNALVFIPDAMIGMGPEFDLRFREFHFTLRLPLTGEEIDSNTIDWHISELKKNKKKTKA
jgi:hypothetical protein